jgi:hypothetical protein
MSFLNELKKGVACDSAGKPDSVLGRAVCLSVHPGKMLLFPFLHWFEKRYQHRYKFARIMFAIDLILVGVVLTLALTAIFFAFFTPDRFEDDIHLSATVAPREIVAGAPSTLVIRYTNETDQELRNLRLSFTYPDHFLLQEIEHNGEPADENITLDSLAVGENGSVRIRGVMFGEVGGEQTFLSEMAFVYGEEFDKAGRKGDTFTFSPASSTLSLELVLPEKVVSMQELEGMIRYSNTGEIDFPAISIEPTWPDAFSYLSADVTLSNNRFQLPAILAGESGEMTFGGFLGDVGDEALFMFAPFFSFETIEYQQTILEHVAEVIPPQLELNHSMDSSSLVPGSDMDVTITYTNTGETDVSDAVLGFESESVFLSEDAFTVDSDDYPKLALIEPGMSGSVVVSAPLRSWISQSETDFYEALEISTRTTASYVIEDGSGQQIATRGSYVSAIVTTPIIFESFGRFTASSGDQLGRGPLPPRAGLETKYWVFWHISNTTNPIENLRIEGSLAENVSFTGRQTVSTGNALEYDASTGTVYWEAGAIDTTMSPISKTVGVAFELGITPTEDQIGSEPTLLSNIFLSGTDATTGVFVSRYGSAISTHLPSDALASGKSIVE